MPRWFRVTVVVVPFAAGVVTTVVLWGDRAEPMFFSTAAEVIALGAVGMALQGGLFRVAGGDRDRRRGGWAMASVLIPVGVGLAFAFGALARGDGGSDAHLAITAGALAMGISAFALQALFGETDSS